jgi:hypothetical protein
MSKTLQISTKLSRNVLSLLPQANYMSLKTFERRNIKPENHWYNVDHWQVGAAGTLLF